MNIRTFTLNLDTDALQESCLASSLPHFYDNYNIQNIFKKPFANPLLEAIRPLFRQIESEGAYYINGWLNVYTHEHPSLGYHRHIVGFEGNYHGVFTVSSPPNQYTEFLSDDGVEERVLSVSNSILFCNTEDSQHKTTSVSGDERRITIAFDILNEDTINHVFGDNNLDFIKLT
jgi:hypothetical protein